MIDVGPLHMRGCTIGDRQQFLHAGPAFAVLGISFAQGSRDHSAFSSLSPAYAPSAKSLASVGKSCLALAIVPGAGCAVAVLTRGCAGQVLPSPSRRM